MISPYCRDAQVWCPHKRTLPVSQIQEDPDECASTCERIDELETRIIKLKEDNEQLVMALRAVKAIMETVK
jgi:hypothetical protein